MNAEITRELFFEAAHHLPPAGPWHKCSRLHGHLFRVEVTVEGPIDETTGWVMDFGVLAAAASEVVGVLDHRVLNEVDGIGVPTSENIARYIFDRVAARVPYLSAVTVHESPTSRCTWRPGRRKTFEDTASWFTVGGGAHVFSAAHFLLEPPVGREAIHGHDYAASITLRVPGGEASPDIAEVERVLSAVVKDLDHRLLLPSSPVCGRLERERDEMVLWMGPETLRLPAADCTLLDLGNTTTEGIASVIGKRLAASDTMLACGADCMIVEVRESGASAARVEIHKEAIQ